jgi:hypothetical protein
LARGELSVGALAPFPQAARQVRAENVRGSWHRAPMPKKRLPTCRFHWYYGPNALFVQARQQLRALEGTTLALDVKHARERIQERRVPVDQLLNFQPDEWDIVSVDVSKKGGRIRYLAIRKQLTARKYLWLVLAHNQVITAWVRSGRHVPTNVGTVTDGPRWASTKNASLLALTQNFDEPSIYEVLRAGPGNERYAIPLDWRPITHDEFLDRVGLLDAATQPVERGTGLHELVAKALRWVNDARDRFWVHREHAAVPELDEIIALDTGWLKAA